MAAPLEQSPYFTARLQRGELVVPDLPKFDLDSYISNYSGQIKIQRLLHIACHSLALAVDALRLAIPAAMRGCNTDTYSKATTLLYEISPKDPQATPDTEWVEKRNKENKRETERLEQELKGYKNNLIKESIRMGQEDIASHYLATSDFENASRAFQRMREYCTTPKHVAEMTIKLVYTCIVSGQWIMAQSHCQRARILSIKQEEKIKFDPAIEACSGLAYLGVQDYAAAAKAFLRVSPTYISSEPVAGIDFQKQVLSANDIAVYGGLAALASMDRKQLRTDVLENSEFRTFLELEPHIRRAIASFCDAKYSACLAALQAYQTDYLLDLFLAPHVNNLYQNIRSKSIVQFFVPFSHVRIADLAAAFPQAGQTQLSEQAKAQAMELELVDMISSGALDARIDAVEGLLLAPPRDARLETQQGVIDTAAEIERALRLKLHRMNLTLAGLELSSKGSRGGGGGGKMAWAGSDMGTPMSNA